MERISPDLDKMRRERRERKREVLHHLGAAGVVLVVTAGVGWGISKVPEFSNRHIEPRIERILKTAIEDTTPSIPDGDQPIGLQFPPPTPHPHPERPGITTTPSPQP